MPEPHYPSRKLLFLRILSAKRIKKRLISLLRCVQLGISMADMELLSIGLINDMYSENRNDECKYAELATQEDMERF